MLIVCYFLYFSRLHIVLIYVQNREERVSWEEGLLLRQERRAGVGVQSSLSLLILWCCSRS